MKWNVQQFAFGSGHLLDGSIGSIISFDLIKRSFRINDAIGQLPTKSVQPGCPGVCPNSNSRRFSKTPETAGMRHTGCWPAPIDGANTTRQRNCPGSMGLEDDAINNFRSLADAANTMKSAPIRAVRPCAQPTPSRRRRSWPMAPTESEFVAINRARPWRSNMNTALLWDTS